MRFVSTRCGRRWAVPLLLLWCLVVQGAPAQDAGFLKVHAGPLDTIDVIVDGHAYALAAPSVHPWPVGTHRLIVRNPQVLDFAQLDFDTTFEIRIHDTTQVYVEFPKLIRVQSNPSGASLDLNGRYLGTTPIYAKSGELRVSDSILLSKPGYHRRTWNLTASVLDSPSVTIGLMADQSAGAIQLPVNAYWKHKGHERHSRTLMVAAGMAVVSGAVTAYFKNKADDYFERAKLARQAGNVALQKQLEKRTRRHDRYAAVGFVAMEVNVMIVLGVLLLGK